MTELLRGDAVLATLRNQKDFVSGAAIAESLGITRAAVWKLVGKLRDHGYIIEALPAKGYRLTATPEFSIEDVRACVAQGTFFSPEGIRFFPSLTSTNSKAAELAAQGGSEGLVIVTDKQTAGRGRLARSWESPAGVNVYMSAILRPDMPPKDATILTLLAGVASATALRECTGVNVLLKWPNDLMVGRKKLGGILTEMRAVPDRIQFAVIGIGINVNYHVVYMPKSIRPIATSLAHEAGSCFSRSQILSALITSLDEWLVVLREEGKGPILTEWLKLSCTIGRAVSVSLGNTSARGVAQGLDNEGFLIIRQEDGTLQKVLAGDISHV